MTTPVKLSINIVKGTTQRVPLIRRYVGYAIKGNDREGYVDAVTGAPVPDNDFTDEDYAGCSARMQLREDADSPVVLWEMSSEDSRLQLHGNTITLIFSAEDSAGFNFDTAVGHIEVTRPGGDVERQYELKFKTSAEVTR